MRHVSSRTHAEIEQYVDAVRRRHGRQGLIILAEICNRALRTVPLTDAVTGRQRISLIGP